LATYVKGEENITRKVIIDEHCAITTHRAVNLTHIDEWAKQRNEAEKVVAERLQFHEEEVAAAVNGSIKKTTLRKYRKTKRAFDALVVAKDVLQALAESLPRWLGKEGKIQLDPHIHAQLQKLIKAARIVAGKRKRMPTTSEWEKAVFENGQPKAIPLRALTAIALTLEHGDGFVRNSQLNVVDTSNCYDAIIDYNAIVLDATPSQTIIDMVKSSGGEVHMPVVKQHVKIYRHPTRFWGTMAWSLDNPRRSEEEAKYIALLKHHYVKNKIAFLMHRPAREFFHYDPKSENTRRMINDIDPTLKDEPLPIGHWGLDHRAHNQWTGKNMVIIGSFWPPQSSLARIVHGRPCCCPFCWGQPKSMA